MKHTFTLTPVMRVTAVLGLTALFAGLGTLSPARADDDWHFHRDYAQGHYDMNAVHRDENRLRDLYVQRRTAKANHNWNRVHTLDGRISSLRARLDTDKYVLRRDHH